MMMVSEQQRKYGLDIPTAYVSTDYTCCPGVSDSRPNICFIPDAILGDEFVCENIRYSQLAVSGIPVRQQFYKSTDKATAKTQFGIPEDAPNLLLMCGSMGCGPMEEMLDSFLMEASFHITYAGRTLGWNVLPDVLMLSGMLFLLFSLKVHTDDKYHPTWGDRIDGRRIRTAPAMEQITAYFMPNRNGANNMFSESVEITELERYVRRKRREGLSNFGMSHVIMAAYVRTVAKYPALNRFIAGQKIYSRGEDIALCMTVKKEMRSDAPDSVIKVHLHPADTAADVYRKFQEQVEKAKNEMENTSADNTAAVFMMIPSLVLKFVMWLLKTLDYFCLVPAFLLEVSPFHGSVYFTSMGSLGVKPVYHHLYDFGTVPAFCAFGRKRHAEEIKDGEIIERKYVDLKFNLDERICDGFYYAGVIKYFLRLLAHPNVLDETPETIEADIP